MWMRMGIPQCKSTIDLPQHLQYSKAHVIEQVDTIMIIHNPFDYESGPNIKCIGANAIPNKGNLNHMHHSKGKPNNFM